jgi:hypothetical protein
MKAVSTIRVKIASLGIKAFQTQAFEGDGGFAQNGAKM